MADSSTFTDGVAATTGGCSIEEAIRNVKALIVQVTATPRPNYSVEGHNYSWGEYLTVLGTQLEQLMKIRSQERPFEIVTGYGGE